MFQLPPVSRRHLLAGLATLAVVLPARAQSSLDAASLGLVGDSENDQSAVLQQALDLAAGTGQVLRLPHGNIFAQGLNFPGGIVVEGVPGSTTIAALDGSSGIGSLYERGSLVLRDIAFAGRPGSPDSPALLDFEYGNDITIERCTFGDAPGTAIQVFDAALTIRDCRFTAIGDAAIHAMDSRGLFISNNRIDGCGNAGIRIWRGENAPDGSIIIGNHIANIDWRGGGNGQNGNGVNVFKADEVIVASNHFADCAFTAVRLNSTNNTQVAGNTCLRSGEVAIFSEFAFSGSVIANNIIDGAATGISITNLDSGGQLAVCTGNIVRNITPTSPVNPDTIPIGIFAEAETAITGNTVQNVPGIAIMAGYGTFLRNVLIADNVISDSQIGIGVSVVEGAGPVHIADNLIHEPELYAIVGLQWQDVVETELKANLGKYPHVSMN